MARRTLGTALIAALASALAAGPAAAEEEAAARSKHPIDVGIFGGYHFFSKNNALGSYDLMPRDTAPDDPTVPAHGPILGLRVGVRLAKFLSIEGEVGGIKSFSRGADGEDFMNGDDAILALVWRGHALIHILDPDAKLGLDFSIGGGGMTTADSDYRGIFADTDTMVDFGPVVRFGVGETWGLRADFRVTLPPSIRKEGVAGVTFDFEPTLSLWKSFGSAPKKEEPKVETPVVGDSDGDGILDDADQCKTEAEDKDGFEDTDGCPDADNDGDGVADADDKCPTEAEDKDSFQDEDGCPDPDNDGDGIADGSDQCPSEAEDKDGFEDENGCPDPDNDGDGVGDADDKCPTELETRNGFEDGDGCPDEIPEQVKKYSGTIKGINFVTGKAEITKGSFKTLDAALAVLNEYQSVRLEIQGHTDDVGKREDNLTLSQARADAVKAYFVGKGLDEARLRAVGYGPDKPVDPKKTKAARAKNRRVEFQLITEPGGAVAPPAAPAEPPAPPPQ